MLGAVVGVHETFVGACVGAAVGAYDGDADGKYVGPSVGLCVIGARVGDTLGCAVGPDVISAPTACAQHSRVARATSSPPYITPTPFIAFSSRPRTSKNARRWHTRSRENSAIDFCQFGVPSGPIGISAPWTLPPKIECGTPWWCSMGVSPPSPVSPPCSHAFPVDSSNDAPVPSAASAYSPRCRAHAAEPAADTPALIPRFS